MEAEPAQSKAAKMRSWASWGDSGAALTFRDVACSVGPRAKPKVLLEDAAGFCGAGQALAIIGPSGAGKTTLLDVIARRKTSGRWTGDVRLSGQHLSDAAFLAHTGYVGAGDVLTAHCTCRDGLSFVAVLRLPRNASSASRREWVDGVLAAMRLEHRADSRIGSTLVRGISTGERKRLQVACELLPSVRLLLMDEPTTGLDSATGKEVISCVLEAVRLRKLACVAVLHQASGSILEQFDLIMALANGHMCYFGPTTAAPRYFELTGTPIEGNPGDCYAEALAMRSSTMIEAWKGSEARAALMQRLDALHSENPAAESDGPLEVPKGLVSWGCGGAGPPALWPTQFWRIFRREFGATVRDRSLGLFLILTALIGGLFIGLMFYGSSRTDYRGTSARIAASTMIVAILALLSFSFASHVIEQRKQYYHELAAGCYVRSAYLAAVFANWLAWQCLVVAIFMVIALGMAGWNPANLGRYIGYGLSASFPAAALALLITNVSPTTTFASAVLTLVAFTVWMLGGRHPTNSTLYTMHPSVKVFWQWFSYVRLWYIPAVREECADMKFTCQPQDMLQLPIGKMSGQGSNRTAAARLQAAARGNVTLLRILNAFPGVEEAHAAATDLLALSERVRDFEAAAAAVQGGGVPDAAEAASTLAQAASIARSAFASAVNATGEAAISAALGAAFAAHGLLAFASSVAPGVGTVPHCRLTTGDEFLAIQAGFDWIHWDDHGIIVGHGVDHPNVTPTGFYIAVAFITGIGWLFMAYIALWFCNFRSN
ncbi:P-loop containing nucleoside triphosphate hydrolase protein [Hyaloraphidium curvatum]|nr:P-loop containing nucleoside triphosphate hydrolase protein [Hyaloraphidium curvatum]